MASPGYAAAACESLPSNFHQQGQFHPYTSPKPRSTFASLSGAGNLTFPRGHTLIREFALVA